MLYKVKRLCRLDFAYFAQFLVGLININVWNILSNCFVKYSRIYESLGAICNKKQSLILYYSVVVRRLLKQLGVVIYI